MTATRPPRKPRPPLDASSLQELALAYVARFATSRTKLERYLARKVNERGWDGSGDPRDAPSAASARMCELGYVDDTAYAAARARTLTARGLGARRLSADLAAAGIAESVRSQVSASVDAVEAAMRFAQKRRFGPFAMADADPAARQKQAGAMLRAGHGYDLVRKILACRPGEMPDFS